MPLLPAVAVLLTLAAARGAPSPEEERLFAQGVQAFDAGDARGAERAWKQGYAVAHDPAFLVRIGEAQEKEGQEGAAEAALSYRRYLREAPDAADRADVEQRIARLAPAQAPPAPEPAATRELGAPAELPATPAPGPGDEVRPGAVDAERARAATDDEGGWTRANVTAWAATGATVLLVGTAAFFAAEASSHASDVDRLTSFHDMSGVPLTYTPDIARQYESAQSAGRHDARVATGFVLAAAGTAAVACGFFVIDGVWPAKTADSGLAVAPTTAGRGALGAWSWRF